LPRTWGTKTSRQIPQPAEKVIPDGLRIPSNSTVTVQRFIPQSEFTGVVFGVAIHLGGEGSCSHTPAIASAYIEVKLRIQWSGLITDADIGSFLSQLADQHNLCALATYPQDPVAVPRCLSDGGASPVQVTMEAYLPGASTALRCAGQARRAAEAAAACLIR
jgi:hypothetical protein